MSGENMLVVCSKRFSVGSSPRERGKLASTLRGLTSKRLIPA
ncbi:hypothetical protein HMPREF1978_01866 [Actinomyces graevenitzii F0530]|uniref:Uncharacterized protein n=1 Tax=Actinomyces graevenitzii F0530 TaxID=1321817 RepID=U1R3G7_9ACTO|nr:hypothetical protein HMPREF1978_01866 [Actinomyces graevenitzii F0530]